MRVTSWVAVFGLLCIALGSVASSAGETRAHGDNIHIGNYYFCDISFQNGVCDRTFQVGTEVVWETFEGGHTIVECDETFTATACPPPGGLQPRHGDAGRLAVSDVQHPGSVRVLVQFPSRPDARAYPRAGAAHVLADAGTDS